MQMSVARRLAEAVGSWLHLEFCCYRAGMLSEGSLKAVVGQMLSTFPISRPGTRVYADFPHEGLNPLPKSGRKKEVDFALILAGKGIPKNGAEILVEAKWANSSHCTPENMFADFLRLAVLKRADPAAKCIFLLAGTEARLSKAIGVMPFRCSSKDKNFGIGISKGVRKITLDHQNHDHRASYSSSIKSLSLTGLTIPKSFNVLAYDAHPIQSPNGTVDFQARTWEIVAVDADNVNPVNW